MRQFLFAIAVLPALAGIASANTLHFPFYIQGYGYSSQITITNMSEVATSVQASAYDMAGTRVADSNLVVGGNDTLTTFVNELVQALPSVGRLEISSSANLSAVVTIVSPVGGFALYPGAGPATTHANLDLFEANNSFDTVLAFSNSSSQAGTMAITAHVGGVTLTLTRSIPANGVVADLASSMFPIQGLGALRIEADVPIHATGILVQRTNSSFVTTVSGRSE
jgi:hypothetical protein